MDSWDDPPCILLAIDEDKGDDIELDPKSAWLGAKRLLLLLARWFIDADEVETLADGCEIWLKLFK